MKPVVIEKNRMICMIEFKEMLESSCSPLVSNLDVMDFHRFERDR